MTPLEPVERDPLGDARPDVEAVFGPRAAQAGYHIDVTTLPPGDYVLTVTATSASTPARTIAKSVSITVTPWAPTIYQWVDLPAPGAVASGSFVVAGWAVALDAPSAESPAA